LLLPHHITSHHITSHHITSHAHLAAHDGTQFGQLQSITHAQRVSFAYYLLAGETNDAELAAAAFAGLAYEGTYHSQRTYHSQLADEGTYHDANHVEGAPPVPPTPREVPRGWEDETGHEDSQLSYRPPPAWVCLASVDVNFGSLSQAVGGLRRYGLEPEEAAKGAQSPMHALDATRNVLTMHRIPGVCAMLQRMCICLKAVATAVGLVDISPRTGFVPIARRWLENNGLGSRDLAAASAGRKWREEAI